MYVTIWRHGEAGSATSDRERQLTAQGKQDIAVGQRCFEKACLQRQLPLPDTLWHSPWRRTSQTAAILSSAAWGQNYRQHSALRPGSDLATVDSALAEYVTPGEQQHILLVSHQPLVSRLIDHYLGSYGEVPGLSPGAFAVLKLDFPGAGCAGTVYCAFPPDYTVAI